MYILFVGECSLTQLYSIINKCNGKIYVGQSVNIRKRWQKHINRLKSNKHNNRHLQSSWNKYGEDSFIFGVLEECSEENLNDNEIWWIKYFDSTSKTKGYNISFGGASTFKGLTHSEETKRKMSGENHWLYGKSPSKEMRKKISDTLKGRVISEEHASKISKAMMGHVVSDEVRQKMSDNHYDCSDENNPRFLKHLPTSRELYVEWRNGCSQSDLASKYGCGTATIQRRLKKYIDSIKDKPQLRTSGKRKDGKVMYCIYWKGEYVKYSVYKDKLVEWFENEYGVEVILF